MTKLSVNINKIATLRNARGGNVPDVIKVASDIESYGAQGITVHPRPDERHIRYQDARDLKAIVKTEFNIEGNPVPKFIDLVLEVRPDQVTLVPDAVDAITSNAGWDTIANRTFLQETISIFKEHGIRTSIFVDPVSEMIKGSVETGTDRIELYTESFAKGYAEAQNAGFGEQAKIDTMAGAVAPYTQAAELAHELGLGINAGHDLSLDNIQYFKQQVPHLLEVSIGHALICESLYLGLENVINMYKHRMR